MRVEFDSGMVWSVGPGFPEVRVQGRGWVHPSLLEPGDAVPLCDPASPRACDVVSHVVRDCADCGSALGTVPDCPGCLVARVMLS